MTTTVLITGNTYPVKDQLKALGGRWDAGSKGWRVPAAQAVAARALVAAAPKSTSANTGFRPSGRRTGCSCGSRTDSSGQLIPSSRNCSQCNFDEYDC